MQILVLGMHRSGTSLVTRLLNTMGVHLGEMGSLMEAHPANPKGFWENNKVVEINDEILRAQDCAWQVVSKFDVGLLDGDAIASFQDLVRGFLTQMDAFRPWAIKDPRLCLTTPVWASLLEVPVVVFVHRRPLEVAQSLHTTHNTPLTAGVALWEAYTLAALQSSFKMPRVVVSYSELLSDPIGETARIYNELVSHGVHRISLPGEKEIRAFVSEDLHRERAGEKEQDAYLNIPQRRIYKALQSGAAFNMTTVPKQSKGGLRTLELFEELLSLEKVGGRYPELLKRSENLQQEIAHREEAIRAKEEELSAKSRDLEMIHAALEEAESSMLDHEELEKQHTELTVQSEQQRQQLAFARQHLLRMRGLENYYHHSKWSESDQFRKVTQLEIQVAEVQEHLERARERCQEYQLSLSQRDWLAGNLKDSLQRIENERDQILERSAVLEQRIESDRTKLEYALAECDRLNELTRDSEAAIMERDVLHSQIDAVNAENAQLSTALRDVEEAAAEEHKQRLKVSTEYARLRTVYDEVSRSSTMRREQVFQLEEELRLLNGQTAALRGLYTRAMSGLDGLIERQKALVGYSEQMHAGAWWKLGMRLRMVSRLLLLKRRRPKWPADEARKHHAKTVLKYRLDYTDPTGGAGVAVPRSAEVLAQLHRDRIHAYKADRDLLLSWLAELHKCVNEMHAISWWQFGMKIRGVLGAIRIMNPKPNMEVDRANALWLRVEEWKARRGGTVNVSQAKADSGRRLADDIRKLVLWTEEMFGLLDDMSRVGWWSIGAMLGQGGYRNVLNGYAVTAMRDCRKWLEESGRPELRYALPKLPPQRPKPVSSMEVPAVVRAVPGIPAAPVVPVPVQSFAGENPTQFLFSLPRIIDILIPVYNGYRVVRKCIQSILKHTTYPFRIVIIDDCSSEAALLEYFKELSSLPFVQIHRNEENLGFVGSVNAGFRICENDIALLNSDVCVTPRWLRKLVVCANREQDIASVTTLSNAATIFSLPKYGECNLIPPGQTIVSMARLVEDLADGRIWDVPTAVGCCMYIKQRAVRDVGYFDEENFGRGYGEENDFCMRAMAKGWRIVLDPSIFIYHEDSATFGPEKLKLIEGNLERLTQLHPDYMAEVARFVEKGVIQEILAGVNHRLAEAQRVPAAASQFLCAQESKRLMYVIHDGGGGTSHMALDLLDALPTRYEVYYLICNTETIYLRSYTRGRGLHDIESHTLSSKIRITDFHHAEYASVVAGILTRYHFDLIHIHHLISHSLDLPRIATAMRIPFIVTFHDLYFVCPTVHLLNYDEKFCGGNCVASGDRQCVLPTPNLREAPLLPGKWANTWRREVSEALRGAAGFMAPTQVTKDFLVKMYPEFNKTQFLAVRHGRDVETVASVAVSPTGDGPVRLVTMGDVVLHKGADLLKRLAEDDVDGLIEIHVLGTCDAELASMKGIVAHGPYQREDLPRLLSEIRPSFGLFLSIWPETFCYTLTEAWACGLPVIVSNLGALQERVQGGGGGWIVDVQQPELLYAQVAGIVRDLEGYEAQRAAVDAKSFKEVSQMAVEYHHYYNSIISGEGLKALGKIRTKPVFAVVPQTRPNPYNCTDCYRLVLPYQALGEAGMIDTVICDLDTLADVFPDAVVVQRTGLTDEEADALIEYCRENDVKIIYDIDDHLLAMDNHPSRHEVEPYFAVIERMLRTADFVTVSTDQLRIAFSEYNPNVLVVPNGLDQRLWTDDGKEIALPAGREDGQSIVFGYMGTATHINDLEMIKKAIIEVQARNKNVRFELVGGRGDDTGQDWYSRVVVDGDNWEFLNFVGWFRSNCNWDFAIAPLEVNEFNEFKSPIKALEYAARGLPAIYSDHTVYQATVEDGVNGLLVENTTEAWIAALERMIQDAELRRNIREEAFRRVARDHILQKNLDNYMPLIEQVSSKVKGVKKEATTSNGGRRGNAKKGKRGKKARQSR